MYSRGENVKLQNCTPIETASERKQDLKMGTVCFYMIYISKEF